MAQSATPLDHVHAISPFQRVDLNVIRVGLVRGSQSSERAVSFMTAREVMAGLTVRGHEVIELELDGELPAALVRNKVDVVFPAVHGAPGENGVLQGCLELLGIPYVGSGVLASALAMNKNMAKRVFASAGLPCARGIVIRKLGVPEAEEQVRQALGEAPYMVKPNAEGSAIGATRVFDDKLLGPALDLALRTSGEVIVEQFIHGREMTVGVLEDDNEARALPVIQIIPKMSWYDYTARYTAGMSEHVCPAQISVAETQALQDAAVRAHRALECRDYSRMDCLLSNAGTLVVLEVNTLPGMTSTSLFPDAARVAGMSFETLVDHLVRRAYARRTK